MPTPRRLRARVRSPGYRVRRVRRTLHLDRRLRRRLEPRLVECRVALPLDEFEPPAIGHLEGDRVLGRVVLRQPEQTAPEGTLSVQVVDDDTNPRRRTERHVMTRPIPRPSPRHGALSIGRFQITAPSSRCFGSQKLGKLSGPDAGRGDRNAEVVATLVSASFPPDQGSALGSATGDG
jgi:hypothetical protein